MKLTGYVILGVAVALLGWEGYALTTPGVEPITTVIVEWNRGTEGLVALLFGTLMGHFFFARQRVKDRQTIDRLQGRIAELEHRLRLASVPP